MPARQNESTPGPPSHESLPATAKATELLVFRLDETRYALHLDQVDRAVRAVEITPLPSSPGVVLGVINVGGEIVAALDIRKRLRLPEREVQVNDQMVLARTSRRAVAILVDAVVGLLERAEEEIVRAELVIPGLEHVEGILKLGDGLVLIHDLDRFLSLDEERHLDEAIRAGGRSS